MVKTLLILWSIFASVAALAIGVFVAMSTYGGRWPGIVLCLAAIMMGATSIHLASQEWGRRHRHYQPIVHTAPPTVRGAATKTLPPAPPTVPKKVVNHPPAPQGHVAAVG